MQAETPEARSALVENLPMLRERLAEQGIRIDRFDVDLMDHSDRQQQQSLGDQPRGESSKRTQPEPGTSPRAGVAVREATSVSSAGGGPAGLNVVV